MVIIGYNGLIKSLLLIDDDWNGLIVSLAKRCGFEECS